MIDWFGKYSIIARRAREERFAASRNCGALVLRAVAPMESPTRAKRTRSNELFPCRMCPKSSAVVAKLCADLLSLGEEDSRVLLVVGISQLFLSRYQASSLSSQLVMLIRTDERPADRPATNDSNHRDFRVERGRKEPAVKLRRWLLTRQ